MFQSLSDALALVLALSIAEPGTQRPAVEAAHAERPTRWGTLAVTRSPDDREHLTLDGQRVEGIAADNLWIVRVEPLSPREDRALIASGMADSGVPTRFTALTVSRAGARVERGAIALEIDQASR
jgi:hypothetical protein